jgi:hypothetical protein
MDHRNGAMVMHPHEYKKLKAEDGRPTGTAPPNHAPRDPTEPSCYSARGPPIAHEYDRAKAGETHPLKPVLASIPNALKYMGDVSRAKFYSDILPLLQTVHIGTRHFVVVESMDRLISTLLSNGSAEPQRARRGLPRKAQIKGAA